MADIAKASIVVTPRFPGLARSVEAALGGVDTTRAGTRAGAAFGNALGGGLLKTGAVVGAATTLASKAIGAMESQVGSAVARFDTLNNYPKVMQQLGYEAREATDSVSKMSERLQGLPTSLDSMASTVQGLTVLTGDIGRATDAGLALNDMLVASGSSAQLTSAAMEQFRQMLAKGKPEMEDWRSLTSAMPGQMDQLAKAMLGPTANANDLYAALGGGKNDAVVSMDELLDAMIRLDSEGGESFASFEEQARAASGGVATSMDNLNTAVARGLADTMEAIGKDEIAGAFAGVKDGVDAAFKAVNSAVRSAMPTIKSLLSTIGEMAPTLSAAAAGFAAVKTAGGAVASVVPKVTGLVGALKLAAGGAGTLKESLSLVGVKLNPVAIGVTAVAGAAAIAAAAFADWKRKTDNAKKAAEGLSDAVRRASSVGDYRGALEGVGESASKAAADMDGLNARIAANVDAMNEATDGAQAQISELSAAQQAISDYSGQSDLSTTAQGKLEWAIGLVNDQFGTQITMADAVNGFYTDQDGNVRALTDSVNDLIDAKKREIELDMLSEQVSAAESSAKEAADAYAAAWDGYAAKVEEIKSDLTSGNSMSGLGGTGWLANPDALDAEARRQADEWLSGFADKARETEDAVNGLYAAMGDVDKAASSSADEFDAWGNSLSRNVRAMLERSAGPNGLGLLKADLEQLGVSVTDLTALTEPELMDLAAAYDGTAGSVAAALESMGVKVDESKLSSVQAAADVQNAFGEMGLSLNGIDLQTFSQKLADAGVSAEDLRSIGSFNLGQLAVDCENDMGRMVEAIKGYNSQPLSDKSASVNIFRNVFETISHVFGNAAGGIRLNAEGGFRMHAGGAIATRAVPLDIVGEAGAEAIVPLTNERYSRPFARLIAEEVSASRGDTYTVGNITVQVKEISDADPVKVVTEFARRANRAMGR